MTKSLIGSIFCLLVCYSSTLLAQGGVSSSSVGISRAGLSRTTSAGRFRMPAPEYFRVEEFVNYHRHDLPLPANGSRVHLDLRQVAINDEKAIVQVGISTPRALDPKVMPPLNLVLVIDQSGSMSGDRIANVKKAIRSFIERIRAVDRVAIVGFSDRANLLLDSCTKTDQQRINRAIDQIEAGGSTNLHGGLMLGYKTAMDSFDSERTNRVILLTDGIANVGKTTDPKEIARQSREYNKEGISLSTIGVGNNFNHDLLRSLADAGKGLIHFVNDSKDIRKTFVDEVDALLAPAASNLKLEVSIPGRCEVKVFGYEPRKSKGRFIFELDDLNHGATQVFLFEVKNETPVINALLTGKDAVTGKKIKVAVSNLDGGLSTAQLCSVKRNYGIALVGESLKKASIASNNDECEKAEKVLKKGIDRACKQVGGEKDPHLERIVRIAKDYRGKILGCIERFGD